MTSGPHNSSCSELSHVISASRARIPPSYGDQLFFRGVTPQRFFSRSRLKEQILCDPLATKRIVECRSLIFN